MMNENRIRIVYVSFSLWLSQLLRGDLARCVNLPTDVKVIKAEPSVDRFGRDVAVWLSSPDFDPVEDGGLIPEHMLRFHKMQCSDCAHAEPCPDYGVNVYACKRGVSWKGADDIEPDSLMPSDFGCTLYEPCK